MGYILYNVLFVLKMFASTQGKYEHKKYVKCKHPPQNNISTTTN